MAARRHDPRVDLLSNPPASNSEDNAVSVDRIDVSALPVAPVRPQSSVPATAHVVTSDDARVESLDRRIRDNDWRGIAADCGTLAEVGNLPPNLALLAALAHHELTETGSQEAVAVGVRCIAALLRVPEDGAIAGVVARRLFRKNPVRFRDRKAPTPRMSLMIVAITLALGGTVGWLLSGGLGVVRHALHLGAW